MAEATDESKGLSINCKKTKMMCVSKMTPEPAFVLTSGDKTIEQVSSFNYLGAMITADGRSKKEIRRRIGWAEDAFNKMRAIFTDRKLSLNIKLRLIRTFVWLLLLFGGEAWTLNPETRRNIEAAEICFNQRTLKISYLDHVTIEEFCTVCKWNKNF